MGPCSELNKLSHSLCGLTYVNQDAIVDELRKECSFFASPFFIMYSRSLSSVCFTEQVIGLNVVRLFRKKIRTMPTASNNIRRSNSDPGKGMQSHSLVPYLTRRCKRSSSRRKGRPCNYYSTQHFGVEVREGGEFDVVESGKRRVASHANFENQT